jgi:hypothetical protein
MFIYILCFIVILESDSYSFNLHPKLVVVTMSTFQTCDLWASLQHNALGDGAARRVGESPDDCYKSRWSGGRLASGYDRDAGAAARFRWEYLLFI